MTPRRVVLSCSLVWVASFMMGCEGDGGARLEPSTAVRAPTAPAVSPVTAVPARSSGASENLAAGELDPFSLPDGLHAASGPLTPSTTTLPVDETYGGSAGWAFKITQAGSGNAGWFRITSPSSMNRMALLATHTGEGIAARAINAGRGRALWAQVTEPSNPFDALVATHVGGANALFGLNVGSGAAGRFEVRNPANSNPAVFASTDGTGSAGLFFVSEAGSIAEAVSAFTVGTGSAGAFTVSNPASIVPALRASTDGDAPAGRFINLFSGACCDASGVQAESASSFAVDGEGTGPAGSGGRFRVTDAANPNRALSVSTAGTGGAALFTVSDAANGSNAVHIQTQGTGTGLFVGHFGSSGDLARFGTGGPTPVTRIDREGRIFATGGIEGSGPSIFITSAADDADAVVVQQSSDNDALDVRHFGSTGEVARFSSGGSTIARIDKSGNVFADGVFNPGGADLAESFDVEGSRLRYEPGDVLAISTDRARQVARSGEPYSSLVIGVYATKPGVLLSEGGSDPSAWSRIPVGVVGVLPTRVTAENGPIAIGDILVSSSRPGHAMKADVGRVREGRIPSGAILGKALEPFDGPGTGLIEVMVNVK